MSSSKEFQKDDFSKLKNLGSKKTKYLYDSPSERILETFENKYQENNYVVKLDFEEFTSLCPKTGQPDFASITIQYEPDKKCIETKSLKLYFFAFRNYGSFMETIVNKILNDMVSACSPKNMSVRGEFKARGGIVLRVFAEYNKE
jgi:7-cyano-7-deazaguanine reductase